MADSRKNARNLFDLGVRAADPFTAVQAQIEKVEEPALILAVGKAARGMARAALLQFPDHPCLIVTNYENAAPLNGAQVFAAGHPTPDQNGARAAEAVLEAVKMSDGPILILISGGGSALLPAPPQGVSLADKAALNELLLSAGLDIVKMNLLRQQVSQIKGGGLLRAAGQRSVTALILSDVVGDNLSAIASGPTVAPLGTPEMARKILLESKLWGEVPESIRKHLLTGQKPPDLTQARNILVGSNAHSVAAMAEQVPRLRVLDAVEGDVAEAARLICDQAGPGVTLWGGETTVRLRGTGSGGRNQELALRIACEAMSRGWETWTCLQGGSDGRDGPTDAAGGLVDQGTLERIKNAGGDIDALLRNNDSYKALQLAGDLLITGPTGTNVADLGIMIR